jgi:hypothetical protein
MIHGGLALGLFLVALGTSALGGMLGMASGVFIVPILITFFGIPIHDAVGTGLVSVIACSCGSAASFLRERLTNIRLAIVLEVSTTFGALVGVLLSGVLPTQFLFGLFAVVLALSAFQMLSRREDHSAEAVALDTNRWPQLHSSYPDRELQREVAYQVVRLRAGMALMFGAGVISALLGIGSGVLKIPAMDTALRLPIKVSSATSNFMIGVTATASAAAYFVRGDIPASIAGPVALGSVVGAALGARMLIGLSNEKLRLFFVAVLLILAAQMLLNAVGGHLIVSGG